MKPIIIAGPCVIESEEIMHETAQYISSLNRRYDIDIIFKASFDKANRTSDSSYRGPGLNKGLIILDGIKHRYGLKIITDIHESFQARPVSEVADIIQIPALLCRQTDLIAAAAQNKKTINIKKGQFLSGEDMRFVIDKARHNGAENIWATERGNCFGYNNNIVDFRNIGVIEVLLRSAQVLISALIVLITSQSVEAMVAELSVIGQQILLVSAECASCSNIDDTTSC